jgi:hypothetical protein
MPFLAINVQNLRKLKFTSRFFGFTGNVLEPEKFTEFVFYAKLAVFVRRGFKATEKRQSFKIFLKLLNRFTDHI